MMEEVVVIRKPRYNGDKYTYRLEKTGGGFYYIKVNEPTKVLKVDADKFVNFGFEIVGE